MNVEQVFKNELNLISNQEIKTFIIKVFNEICPDYFWEVACSSSGKYHPQVALGIGGLVRHVKLAVWWGEELLKTWPDDLPGIVHDEVIAALLIHDMVKRGPNNNGDYSGFTDHKDSVGSHGILLSKILREKYGSEIENNEQLKRVVCAARDHMGKWTTNFDKSANEISDKIQHNHIVCITVHLADYCASRKVDDKITRLLREVVE
jgi:hypothetical protein